jgi:glycosyltransferase involved in cell wall biosynthesis
MKILMIAPTPFFADRGSHTQIYEEIKALQKIGHKIVLCTYGLGRDLPGISIVRCVNMPWYEKLSAGPSYTKMLILPFLSFTTIKTIIKFQPDIIHAHLHEGAVIARFCQLFFPKKKYLFDMQGSLSGECLAHNFIKPGSLMHQVMKYSERKISGWFFVITQSEAMIKELENMGAKQEKIRNVKDGVDIDVFSPRQFNDEISKKCGLNPNLPRVLFMGLLEEYQGADLMISAFAAVAKQIPETQFIIIGFPNIEKYQEQSRKLGIEKNTLFLGRIKYEDLPGYLTLSNIAIAPKIAATEGDGKIYNYMAMGMATIAFDRSVSREILGETGIFAEFQSAEDMAEKIIWAINNPAECVKLGQAARARAIANLSWDAVGRRIDEVYKKL